MEVERLGYYTDTKDRRCYVFLVGPEEWSALMRNALTPEEFLTDPGLEDTPEVQSITLKGFRLERSVLPRWHSTYCINRVYFYSGLYRAGSITADAWICLLLKGDKVSLEYINRTFKVDLY